MAQTRSRKGSSKKPDVTKPAQCKDHVANCMCRLCVEWRIVVRRAAVGGHKRAMDLILEGRA